jgi:hypothetical protein
VAQPESLGSDVLQGFGVTGTQLQRFIGPEEVGGTAESWYSEDLKAVLLSKTADPRVGETTSTLTDINRADPDQTPFQGPPDYKVRPGN